MKNILLKLFVCPLVHIYKTIQEAPIIDCDNELIGFGDYVNYITPEKTEKKRKDKLQYRLKY